MAKFEINVNMLNNDELFDYKNELSEYCCNIKSITVQLDKYLNSPEIKLALNRVTKNLSIQSNKMQLLQKTLFSICTIYENTEKNIVGGKKANAKSKSKNSSDESKKDQSFLDKLDTYINDVNTVIQHMDQLYDQIIKAIQDAISINGVVAIGLSGSIGAGAYLSGNVQIVVDMKGNVGLQFGGGTGVEAGASADGTAYAAIYPGKENIKDIEGFGTEVGGSVGEGVVGSLSALFEGEGNDMSPSGFLAGIGLGGEGTVGEGHVTISETFPTIPLGNIYTTQEDAIVDSWNKVYNTWKFAYEKMR